ncbi:MAG: hypothetical protein JNL21_39340 [Myxococcales bacterium]|nr:hypothetical protein [Myxococcales bacterium]
MRKLSFALVLFPLASGCSSEGASPSGKPATSGSAAAPAVALSPYCEQVCKRSTACGLEAAESLAKGHAHELGVVEQLRKDAPKTEATCVEACKASKVTEADGDALARAQGCLEQTTCKTFEGCLVQIGSPAGG